MLTHHLTAADKPPRTIVLGAGGFLGSAFVRRLRAAGIETHGLGRAEVELLGPGASEAILRHLRPKDTLVFVSARAPCKNAAMLVENVRMAEAVCAAMKGAEPGHLVYVSSDAVYKDSEAPLTESSCAEPGSPHGVMHLAREILLRSDYPGPMAIVRPTLVYGLHDPHNGYGPNRFRRLAFAGSDIALFGGGEERRDHIHVDDVAEMVCRIVRHGSTGTLNAVTGEVASFRELAEFTADQFSPRVSVTTSTRVGPMPHGGYRPFDPAAIRAAFPDLKLTPWRIGVAAVCKAQEMAEGS
jgi:nucleoside-diphosphate-sugar epimerase